MTLSQLKDRRFELFEPGMMTPDGLTGSDDAPELLLAASVAKTFAAAGARLNRLNLFDDPMSFIGNAVIADLLRDKGDDGFPALMVDGSLVLHGHYPTAAEWADVTGVSDLEAHLIPVTAEELAAVREALEAESCGGCGGGCGGCSGCGGF